MIKVKKTMTILLIIIFLIGIIIFGLFFVGNPPRAKNIKWGVNFSQKHAFYLGLDWRETYLALMDDLGAKRLKVAAHWDLFEPEKDKYFFNDLDWQMNEAEKRDVEIILVIGMKTGRWPECHIPDWAKNLSKREQQKEIFKMLENIVLKYKENNSIWAWQVENEPFFPFGECPWADKEFLKKEVELVKSLDLQKRPVVISDSGEGSFWIQSAKIGDIVGTTMYRKVWFDFSWLKIKLSFLPDFLKKAGFFLKYPLTPKFYWQKAQIIEKLFDKKVICIEFQSEPWCKNKLIYDCSLQEQKITIDLEQFKKNIEFAKETGLDEFYLWGGEWLYWMKKTQNDSTLWNEAKKLF